MDSHWFWGRMNDDGLIVRLHINTVQDKAPVTEAHVFGCWYDDMHPNRFEMIYRHDDYKLSRSTIQPLELISWGYFEGTWEELFAKLTKGWSKAWLEERDTVCTIGPVRGRASVLEAGHPLVISHLSRLQTLAAVHPDDSFQTSLSITTRRVGGIIRANLNTWRGLVG